MFISRRNANGSRSATNERTLEAHSYELADLGEYPLRVIYRPDGLQTLRSVDRSRADETSVKANLAAHRTGFKGVADAILMAPTLPLGANGRSYGH